MLLSVVILKSEYDLGVRSMLSQSLAGGIRPCGSFATAPKFWSAAARRRFRLADTRLVIDIFECAVRASATTALWIELRIYKRSKAVSRSACHRTPKVLLRTSPY